MRGARVPVAWFTVSVTADSTVLTAAGVSSTGG